MVPPGMAGKLVACPACGGHVTLPGKSAGVTVKAPRSPMPATAPAAAGRPKSNPARQPAKMATFKVDDGDADFEYDEDDGDDYDRRPSRRGKKPNRNVAKAGMNPLLLWGGIGGGAAVLLLGVVVGLVMAFRGGGGSSGALAMVPADALGFVLVRAGDFNKTPSAAAIRKLAGPENEAKLGVGMNELRDIVVIITPKSIKNDEMPIIAISTIKPIDVAGLLASAEFKDATTKKEVGGKTLLVSAKPKSPSVIFHEPSLILLGDEAEITALSAQPPKADAVGPLTPKLRAAAAGNDTFFFGYQVTADMKKWAGPMGGGGMPGMKLSFISDVQAGHIALTEDKAIHGRMALDFADGAKASKAKEDLDAALGMARMMFPQMKGNMPGINPRMMTIAEKALDKARPAVSGSSVEIPLEFEITIGELIEEAKPMMGMFMPGMGPGMGAMPPGPRPGPPPGPFPQPQPIRKKR